MAVPIDVWFPSLQQVPVTNYAMLVVVAAAGTVFLFIEPYARLFYLPRVPVGRDWRQTGTRSVTQSHCCPRLSFVSTRAVERQHREQPKPQPMKTNKHRSACLPFVVAFLYIDPVRS